MSVLVRISLAIISVVFILLPYAGQAADKTVAPKYAPGWQDYAQGYRSLMATKSGNKVTISGLAKKTTNGPWKTIATLPSDMRPKQHLIFNVNTHDKTSRVDVDIKGNVIFQTGEKAYGWVSLDGITFMTGNVQSLKPSKGWQNYGHGYIPLNATLDGDTVTLGGLVKGIAGQAITTLPSHLRPSARRIFNANSNDSNSRVDVLANGEVWWTYPAPDREWVSLNGISFNRKPGNKLKLAAGWTNYGGEYSAPTVSKKGQRVSVSGLLRGGTKWGHLATLPKGHCPEHTLIFNLNNHDRTSRVDVLKDCRIMWVAGGQDHGWISLDGISFFLSNSAAKAASNTSNAGPVSVPWRELPGKAIDIDVGPNGVAWKVGHDQTIWRWDGRRFNKMPGTAKRIAVDPQGNAWIVNQGKSIYRHDGQAWREIQGKALDIDVGADGTVWIIGQDGTIWRWNGQVFKKMTGLGVRIAVDTKGNAWITNSQKNVYRYDGRKWHQIPGQAIDIATGGDGSVWVIGTDNAPYKWEGKPTGNKIWQKYAGAITGISAGPKGYPWAVNGDSKAFTDNRSPTFKTISKISQPSGNSSTAPDASSVQKDIRQNPAFSTLSLSNIKQSNGVLTAKAKVGNHSVTVVAWHAAKGKPAISAILVPNMPISELLPKLRSGNKMAAYKLTNLVVFTVPSGAQNSALKVSSLPKSVADDLKKTNSAMKDSKATISLEPGMTYFGAVNASGIVKTAFDMMQLAQPMSMNGSLALTGYSAPQNTVTLMAALKTDPLTKVMGPIKVITAEKTGKPTVFVTATGTDGIEVGYSSKFKIFNQSLDGKMYFAASGKGAAAETNIGIQLTKKGRWHEPHLFAPVKASNVTLNDSDITLERVIKNTGTSTTISVVTSNTQIHSTKYEPAAFSFTLEGTSNLPKAVFVDLATSELSVLQLAELSEVALQMTPQGQLAAAANPYSSTTIIKKLQLDKLPLGKITIRDPKIFLGTVDAVVPALSPIPDPVLPPISGAGVHVRGKFEAFGKKFAKSEFQLDFNGLKTDTSVRALKMGPFDMGEARFKVDAIPGKQPLAHFSGDASFAGITLAAAEFDLQKDKFSYKFDTGCAPLPPAFGLLKFTASGSSSNLNISDSMFGSVPRPGTCILDALELLSDALKQGTKLVSMGSDLVIGISSDAWKGLSDGASGVLTSGFVNNSIKSFGSADKAASALANTGREAANQLASSITSIFGSGNSTPKPRYKDTPELATDSRNRDGKCFANDDWSIEYARCWRRGHEFVRLASNTNLCLSIRKRIREQGKAIEVQNCDGGWHQQWRWTGPVSADGFASRLGPIVDGWKGDWCMDRRGSTGSPKAGQRLESKECRQEQRQDFVRDRSDRLVHNSGYCLEAYSNRRENEVHLQSCSNNPNQKWVFKAQGSSFKTLLPSLSFQEGTIATTRLVTHQGKCIYTSPFGNNEHQTVGVGTCKMTDGYFWKVTSKTIQSLQNPLWCVGTPGSSNADQNFLDSCVKSSWSINVDNNKLWFSHKSNNVSKCLTASGTKLVFVDCNRDDASQFFEFTRN